MGWNLRIVSSVLALTVSCVLSAAAVAYRNRKQEINEVMIFCKLQYNVFSYFDRLMGFIEETKRSLDICMPGIHNPAIQGKLVEILKKKKIQARILIDKSGYNEWNVVFMEELKEAGAQIKWKSSGPEMRHKFCLLDSDTLMTGTLNWGNDLTSDDWNYVLVTNKPRLLDPVKKEFERLWKSEETNLL